MADPEHDQPPAPDAPSEAAGEAPATAEGAAPAEPEEAPVSPYTAALRQLAALGNSLDTVAMRLATPAELGALREGCGACAAQTPIVYALEAHYAAGYLATGMRPNDRAVARRRTEDWLARPIVRKRGQRGLPAERCPYLLSDGRCLIDAARPIACRINALPERTPQDFVESVGQAMGGLMSFVQRFLPELHAYVLLPSGIYAALAGRDGRNLRKDIRRLKFDARRFVTWPAPETMASGPTEVIEPIREGTAGG